jgi:predicted Zn-dependent protease
LIGAHFEVATGVAGEASSIEVSMRLLPVGRLALVLACGLAPAVAFAHAGLDALDATSREEVAKHPDDPKAHLARARVLQMQGAWDPALEEIELAAARGGDPDVLGQARAFVYLEAGFPRMAKVELDRVLARRPDLYALVFERGRAWLAIGNAEAAARDFGESIAKGPMPTPEQVIMHRDALLGVGKKEEALAALDAGMARLGHVVSLEMPAIDLELELGRPARALERLDALAKTGPPNPVWIARRGEILEKAGRSAEARAEYEKALALIAQKPAERLARPIEDLKRRLELALASTDKGGTGK